MKNTFVNPKFGILGLQSLIAAKIFVSDACNI